MKRKTRRAVRAGIGLGVVVIVGVIAWQLLTGPGGPSGDANRADANRPGPPAGGPTGRTTGIAPADANAAAPGARPPGTRPAEPADGKILALADLSEAEVAALLERGNALLAKRRHAEARAALTKALMSGRLAGEQEQTVRRTLEQLAERMIFSREIFDADPYVMQYRFQPGEVLVKVERRLALHVPTQILLRINGLQRGSQIRAGQTLKLLRGPFHAIVSKSRFTMDIYLHRAGCEPAYVRRLRVGVGKDGSTPVGLWRVGLGRKLERAPWNPPPNAEVRRSIAWGEPDYPLGTRGYWIGLEGLDGNTRLAEGYGIHGTNEPDSIGRAASLGCIRLADPDIELVFHLLYEHWSTVRVLP